MKSSEKPTPILLPLHPDEPDGTIHGFMCKSDFECELGGAAGGVSIYSSIEDVRENRRCVPQCGIVKVAVRVVEIVQPEDFSDV